MRPRGPNVCPRCGERVSAFAAGCAICGADLDPHRADASRSFAGRVRLAADRLRPARVGRGSSTSTWRTR